jgi:small subunit ribosomal protein S8
MMTDTIADMLTRIRNANAIERPAVEMPATKIKKGIAQVLKDEGFILDFQVGHYVKGAEGKRSFEATGDLKRPMAVLRVFLKYGPEGERVIRNVRRISKPGCRIYRGSGEVPPVLDGLGIAILTTNRGVVSDRQAREQKLGGEVLATIW